MWDDLRYTTRTLRSNPGTTFIAIGILAIAIGANTALFTVMNAVLFRPLPAIYNPGELVRLLRIEKREYSSFGYPDYVDYRDRNRSLAGIIAERRVPMSFSHKITERVAGSVATGNYFTVLGVSAHLGRLFGPQDDRTPGAHPVAVISYRFWKRALGSDAGAVGSKLLLNGYPFEIVGVAAESFDGVAIGTRTDVWVPMMMQRQAMPRYSYDFLPLRSAGWLSVYGRLKPGVSVTQARLDLEAIAARLAQAYPETNRGRSVSLSTSVGLYPGQQRSLERLFRYLFASVGLILLIACANLANLFLTRAVVRKREIAVRLAIGVGPWRLFRQLFIEALLIAIGAAAFGLALTPFVIELALQLLGPADVALRTEAPIDLRVVLYTLALVILTSALCGVAPAWRAVKTDILSSLKAGPQNATPTHGPVSVRNLLVVFQVALAFTMLVGGGLLVRTMQHIRSLDTGFSTPGVLLAAVDLSLQHYSGAAGMEFTQRLVERLSAEPGVVSVSISKSEPARDWSDRRPVGHPGDKAGITVDANLTTPGYFQTLGIQLAAGRDFTWQDRSGRQRVCIISERLAAKLWPAESAIGKLLSAPEKPDENQQLEVIGVARDSRYRSLLDDPPLLLYQPLLQNFDSYLSIEVRTLGDPAAFERTLKNAIAALDRDLPVYNVRTFSEQVNASLWEERAATNLVGTFSLLALVLAATGLYAMLAYSISQRSRDIAIRMALGADAARVLTSVIRDAALLAIAGLAVGIIGAVPMTRLGSAFLYGVSALDPITWIVVASAVLSVMLGASYLTARSATRIDPIAVLRDN